MSDLNSTLVTRLKRILLYDLCTSTASTRIQEAIARIEALEAADSLIKHLVNEQAEDEGLWFVAETAAEAYLQQELRRLHRLIEES